MKKIIIIVLIILLFLGVSGVFSFTLNDGYWKDFSLSLFTSFISILFTLFLFDAVNIYRQSRSEDVISKSIAKKLTAPLNELINLMVDLFKATEEKNITKNIQSLDTFFDNDYFSAVIKLDFKKPSPAVTANGPVLWYEYLSKTLTENNNKIKSVIDRYFSYIDLDLFESLEKILESSFVHFITTTPNMFVFVKKMGGFEMPYAMFDMIKDTGEIEKYCNELVSIINRFNRLYAANTKIELRKDIWNNIAPLPGASKV